MRIYCVNNLSVILSARLQTAKCKDTKTWVSSVFFTVAFILLLALAGGSYLLLYIYIYNIYILLLFYFIIYIILHYPSYEDKCPCYLVKSVLKCVNIQNSPHRALSEEVIKRFQISTPQLDNYNVLFILLSL